MLIFHGSIQMDVQTYRIVHFKYIKFTVYTLYLVTLLKKIRITHIKMLTVFLIRHMDDGV